MWKDIDNYSRNCLWQPTEVYSKVWKNIFWSMNWSMYRCWFWMEAATSKWKSCMSNTFWPINWPKWYRCTKCSIHDFNVIHLNFIMIEIWISSSPKYHELTMVVIYTVICIWKLSCVSFILLNYTIFSIYFKILHVEKLQPNLQVMTNQCLSVLQHQLINFLMIQWIKLCHV